MLFYDSIDVSVEIKVNKTTELKGCDICHYCYILDKRFKFQPDVCNWCHNLFMTSIQLSNVAILNYHGADYCCIISRINKSEAIKLMENFNLTEKMQSIIKYDKIYFHK